MAHEPTVGGRRDQGTGSDREELSGVVVGDAVV